MIPKKNTYGYISTKAGIHIYMRFLLFFNMGRKIKGIYIIELKVNMNFGRKALSTKFYNLGKGEKGKGFKKCDFLPKARTWFFLTFLMK